MFVAMNAQRAIFDHGVKPAARTAFFRVESARAAPDSHEGVVDGLFGQILPEQDTASGADHARRLAVVDRLQGRAVTGRATGQRGRKLRFARMVSYSRLAVA